MQVDLIQHKERMRQICDFTGLKFGSITPTDIDGMIEYHGIAYAVIEIKLRNKDVPGGQRKCLERLVCDMEAAGKFAVAMVVQHDVQDTTQSIIVADCDVREVYWGEDPTWRKPRTPMKTRYALELFMKMAIQKEKEQSEKSALEQKGA